MGFYGPLADRLHHRGDEALAVAVPPDKRRYSAAGQLHPQAMADVDEGRDLVMLLLAAQEPLDVTLQVAGLGAAEIFTVR